jgi:RNA 2',3'-cyclic 3'-phosphodiesterase
VRLFVAIEVGSGSGTDPDVAPTHLTLRFLGEVPSESVSAISDAIARTARESRPFELVLEGVGAFPSATRPRVVWVGATRGGTEVSELALRLSRSLELAGFPPERETFVPHVTLFRVRSEGLRRRAHALLSGEEAPPPPRRVDVREIVLKASTLTGRGATHRTVGAFPLGAPPSPAPG